MDTTIIDQGLELMLFGMGTVVLFLTLMVGITTLMSAFIERFFPEPLPALQLPKQGAPVPVADAPIVAAISAAVHSHRRRDKQ